MKFLIKDIFCKCEQIRSFLRIWSHLLKKSLIENFIFCAVFIWNEFPNPVRKMFCTFLAMSTKNLASFQEVAEAYLEPSQPSMMELLFTKSSITRVWLGSKNVCKLLKTNLLRQCLNKYYDVYTCGVYLSLIKRFSTFSRIQLKLSLHNHFSKFPRQNCLK